MLRRLSRTLFSRYGGPTEHAFVERSQVYVDPCIKLLLPAALLGSYLEPATFLSFSRSNLFIANIIQSTRCSHLIHRIALEALLTPRKRCRPPLPPSILPHRSRPKSPQRRSSVQSRSFHLQMNLSSVVKVFGSVHATISAASVVTNLPKLSRYVLLSRS